MRKHRIDMNLLYDHDPEVCQMSYFNLAGARFLAINFFLVFRQTRRHFRA